MIYLLIIYVLWVLIFFVIVYILRQVDVISIH